MNSQAFDPVSFEVPNGLLEVEGNDGATLPFSGNRGPARYQQVYDASHFARVPTGGAFISGIALRADTNSHQSFLSTNVQLRMSTTLKQADELSTVFAENVGLDETLVLNLPHWSPPNAIANTSPNTFLTGNEFVLDTPFFYDPAKGNLLLEIQKSGTEWELGWPPLDRCRVDAQNVLGDPVSRIAAFSLSTNKAEIVDSVGFVTMFEFFPLPTLSVRHETDSLVLNWFWTWNEKQQVWRVQASDLLGSPPPWADYPAAISRTGTWEYSAVLSPVPLDTPRFFRLFWETPQPLLEPVVTVPVQVGPPTSTP